MFKHILVPTDGSEFSQDTVRRAVSFAKEAGAQITAFYAKPATLDEMVDQAVGRALDLFGLSWRPVKRWGQDVGPLTGDA